MSNYTYLMIMIIINAFPMRQISVTIHVGGSKHYLNAKIRLKWQSIPHVGTISHGGESKSGRSTARGHRSLELLFLMASSNQLSSYSLTIHLVNVLQTKRCETRMKTATHAKLVSP